MRPDIRCSSPFRTFIDFDAHTGLVVSPHELRLGRMNLDARFGVTGLSLFADALIAVHTDTTCLSRLGRVWSIVEPDELGSLSIWRLGNTDMMSPTMIDLSPHLSKLGERLFIKLLPEKGNCMAMTTSGQVVVGMGDGKLLLFDIQAPGVPLATIVAHGVSPVVDLAVSSTHICSIGVDGSLRVTSLGSTQVVAGGKLARRFESGEVPSCIAYIDDRIFVGTNKGRVFIYEFAHNELLSFLFTMSMNSFPIRRICITNGNFLVAFDCFVNVYELAQKGNEKHMVRKFQIQTTAQVHAICCWQDLILAGLGDGSLAVYNETTLVYARYFSEEYISVILPGSSGSVWLGADDGRIVECLLPASLSDDLRYSAVPEAVPVPQLVAPSSPMKSKAIKSAALAADDSDDDDWKRGLFAS